jgi:hypothetical protein
MVSWWILWLLMLHGNGTFNNVTGVSEEQWNAAGYDLMTPYPNPFVQSARVRFSVGDEVPVWLGVYTSNGELEGVLVNQSFACRYV